MAIAAADALLKFRSAVSADLAQALRRFTEVTSGDAVKFDQEVAPLRSTLQDLEKEMGVGENVDHGGDTVVASATVRLPVQFQYLKSHAEQVLRDGQTLLSKLDSTVTGWEELVKKKVDFVRDAGRRLVLERARQSAHQREQAIYNTGEVEFLEEVDWIRRRTESVNQNSKLDLINLDAVLGSIDKEFSDILQRRKDLQGLQLQSLALSSNLNLSILSSFYPFAL